MVVMVMMVVIAALISRSPTRASERKPDTPGANIYPMPYRFPNAVFKRLYWYSFLCSSAVVGMFWYCAHPLVL